MDLCVIHHTNKVEQVVTKMQQAVTHWEGLLRATGGALVLEKCFWYLIDFAHLNNKWTYKTSNQSPGSLSILDTDHRQVTIQRLKTSEAQCTLGICLAPDGNMSTELTHLIDTAKEWQCKMKNSKLGQFESNFSL